MLLLTVTFPNSSLPHETNASSMLYPPEFGRPGSPEGLGIFWAGRSASLLPISDSSSDNSESSDSPSSTLSLFSGELSLLSSEGVSSLSAGFPLRGGMLTPRSGRLMRGVIVGRGAIALEAK